MATMTLDEAWEYMDHAHQAEGEARAEYGMGAVSLGYDPAEWMFAYDGYRCSDDSVYAEANRLVTEYHAARALIKVTHWPKPDTTDDIPF